MTRMTSDANSRIHQPMNELATTLPGGDAAHDAAVRRRTAAAWISGGVLWATGGLLYAGSGWLFRASSATFLAADVVLAAAILGLLVLRPHGSSRPATAALVLALTARVVFAIAEVSGLITGTDNTVLLPIAGVLTGLATLAYGALARRASRGLRAATIATGLYFFVVMMPFAAATGEPPALALAAWGVPIALLGLTINRCAARHPGTTGASLAVRSA